MQQPTPAATITARRIRPSSSREQLTTTIRLIGRGIRQAGLDPLVRMHAAEVASSRAGWKDYRGQLEALYDDFLSRWTYVKDPVGQEALQLGRAAYWLTMGRGTPTGRGYGDCDDATIAIGGMAQAIGLTPRICVMAAPGSDRPSHVYPEVHIPGQGWIPVDPVAQPRVQFGAAAPASWRKRYDLDGRPIHGGKIMRGFQGLGGLGDIDTWQGRPLEDYGLAGLDGEEPDNWNDTIVSGFGAYVGEYGFAENPGLLAEVDVITADGLALTPVLELSLGDYQYLTEHGTPYMGMLAFGEEGSTYYWAPSRGLGGFFKKLFKGAKKLVKRVVKKAKKLVKKLPGGKYLVKLHDKVTAFSRKLVKPLAKFVGKYAAKLAPIAALIPGYGTAIAAALYTGGKIANLYNKFDVRTDKKTKQPVFKSPAQAKAFKAALKQAAEQQKRGGKGGRQPARKPATPGHIPAGTPQHAAILEQMKQRAALPMQRARA